MRSGSRDKAAGFVDKYAGRILEAISKLTGRRSAGATDKAARFRGSGRTAKGRAKKRPEGRALWTFEGDLLARMDYLPNYDASDQTWAAPGASRQHVR